MHFKTMMFCPRVSVIVFVCRLWRFMLEEKVQDFGCDVFNEMTMRQRLPKDVFKAVKKLLARQRVTGGSG